MKSRGPWAPPATARLARYAVATLLVLGGGAGLAHAFCGFYVATADAKLYNQASQVVLVRDGERTVMTMANDFKGDPHEFAVVIPVPTLLQRGQIHVADKAWIDHLDSYSAPRLVEYFDPDPCQVYRMQKSFAMAPPVSAATDAAAPARARALGVTIEATYTVGEYDIVILSATQSDGLETWLREGGYRVPPGASRVLGSYIKQGLHFFVAKVNLKEQKRGGFTYLRPLQIAYESPRFMLPIRLGMVNANGPQELFVYALTRNGRVETTNYRTVKFPTGQDVPLFVKDDFTHFYKSTFDHQEAAESMHTVFVEYAWNMSFCDPCSAAPLSPEELRNLGVFWLDDNATGPAAASAAGAVRPKRRPGPGGTDSSTFLTRLHLRYDAAHFPEDLSFQETGDSDSYQARFVLNHPWTGSTTCEQGAAYRRSVRERWQREANNVATLTGWSQDDIRRRMNLPATHTATPGAETEEPWWKKLWNQ